MRPPPVTALLLIMGQLSSRSWAADLDAATRQRIDTCVQDFWKSFVLEDVTAMEKAADAVVVGDIKKGLWVRDRLEKVHHVERDRHAYAAKDVPDLEIVSITESKVISMTGVISEIPTYEVSFTSSVMSGTMNVSRGDRALVVAFTDAIERKSPPSP